MMDKKVCQILNDFKPEMPDGFFWEFNARAKYKGFTFYNLDIIHSCSRSLDMVPLPVLAENRKWVRKPEVKMFFKNRTDSLRPNEAHKF